MEANERNGFCCKEQLLRVWLEQFTLYLGHHLELPFLNLGRMSLLSLFSCGHPASEVFIPEHFLERKENESAVTGGERG